MKNSLIDTNVLIGLYFPGLDNSQEDINKKLIEGNFLILKDFILMEFINSFHRVFFKYKKKEVGGVDIESLDFNEDNFENLQKLNPKWWRKYISEGFFAEGMNILKPVLITIAETFEVNDEIKNAISFAINSEIWNTLNDTADWMIASISRTSNTNVITFDKKINNFLNKKPSD